MQIEVVGHHRGPENPGRQKQLLPVPEARGLGNESQAHLAPIGLEQQHLDCETAAYQCHQGDHKSLKATDPEALQRQQQQGVSGREPHPPEQGEAKEQLKGDGAAHQLGQVAGNDAHLGQQPQGNSAEPRQKLAAGLGQIESRGDA